MATAPKTNDYHTSAATDARRRRSTTRPAEHLEAGNHEKAAAQVAHGHTAHAEQHGRSSSKSRADCAGAPHCGAPHHSALTENATATAVIFDVDGMLVDSVDLHATAWQDAFHDFGHDIDFEEIRSKIDKGADQLMPVFLGEAELDEKADHLEKHRSELLRKHYLDQVTAFPGFASCFSSSWQMRRRSVWPSSARDDELEGYKEVTQIEHLIHAQTSWDDTEESEPDRDIFRLR